MIEVKTFLLERAWLPSSLYDDQPYHVTSCEVVIPGAIRRELEGFLEEFLAFCGYPPHGVYLRIDAFLNPSLACLSILEINARFVDGWGTALNLSRGVGCPVNLAGCHFPALWHLPDASARYRREFILARRELELAGFETREVSSASLAKGDEVYYYGWGYPDRNNQTLVVPAWGHELEDKLELAEFSWRWLGNAVKIPPYYYSPEWRWEEIYREPVIWKFVHKDSPASRRVGASVLYSRNVTDRIKDFLRASYGRRELVAQELIAGLEIHGKTSQVVILTCGTSPVTGYLLLAPRGTRSINDKFEHGPLLFC